MQPTDPQAQPYSSWADIARVLEQFDAPDLAIGEEGETPRPQWMFRGHKRDWYKLEPAIEREPQSKGMGWAALERRVLDEFTSRARIHLGALSVPGDELSWLAMMQHYAVPTRLLDFTYSPFVALYFAVRQENELRSYCSEADTECVRRSPAHRCGARVWAIDAGAVKSQFSAVAWRALEQERRRRGMRTGGRVMDTTLGGQNTERDSMVTQIDEFREQVSELLSYPGTCRTELSRCGCVCPALPPAFNPRFASQQGVFLLNFAQDLSFSQSLNKMMEQCSGWSKTFDIDAGAIPEIEKRLFQMNIHELSLFPDMDGLAGLIRQKIRLQCTT